MKKTNKLKIVLIILSIVLISLISFVGIFVNNKGSMTNAIKDYSLQMELKGKRSINLLVSDEVKSVIKDSEGNIIEDATEEEIAENGYITEEIEVNQNESINIGNFDKVKKIIKNRLEELNIKNYEIRQNKENGSILVDFNEDNNVDLAISAMVSSGRFEVKDSDTNEVLMDNNDLKEAKVLYNTTSSGTTIYLGITFKKDSRYKLEEISKTYVSITDEEGNNVDKKVSITIGDQELVNTSFGETIENGELQLSIGSVGTTNAEVLENSEKAKNIVSLLNNGELPIIYEVDSNKYIETNIDSQNTNFVIFMAIAVVLVFIYSIVKYKKDGIFTSISFVGFVSLLLLIIRLTNVDISFNGIYAIAISLLINCIFNIIILNKFTKKENKKEAIKEGMIRSIFIIVPIFIIALICSFSGYLQIASFGLIMFWGVILTILYNITITRELLLEINKK